MNKYLSEHLDKFARDFLKEGLAKLPNQNFLFFKRMYNQDLNKSIDDTVDSLPVKQLDWAMIQVQNSVDKLNKIV
jgi:hypothetical protein